MALDKLQIPDDLHNAPDGLYGDIPHFLLNVTRGIEAAGWETARAEGQRQLRDIYPEMFGDE